MGQVVFGSVHGSSRSTDSTGSTFTKPSVSILAMERPLAAKANLPFRYSTPGVQGVQGVQGHKATGRSGGRLLLRCLLFGWWAFSWWSASSFWFVLGVDDNPSSVAYILNKITYISTTGPPCRHKTTAVDFPRTKRDRNLMLDSSRTFLLEHLLSLSHPGHFWMCIEDGRHLAAINHPQGRRVLWLEAKVNKVQRWNTPRVDTSSLSEKTLSFLGFFLSFSCGVSKPMHTTSPEPSTLL